MTTLLLTIPSFIKSLINHLWLSVSSVAFYEKIFRSYKGYGFKYAFILSFIASLFCTILLLNNTETLRVYLDKGIISTKTDSLDFIISQLPDMEYDGRRIALTEETPYYINDKSNNKTIAIDPSNKLMPSERVKIPIILGEHKIIINFLDSKGDLFNTTPLGYTQIFGQQPQTLDQSKIKLSLMDLLNKSSYLFIYLIFPILTIVIFSYALLEKSFMILMLYIISHLSGIKISLKTTIRMVLFASGIFILLQSILALTIPSMSTVLWMAQSWANLLMILGILKASGRKILFLK